MAENQVASPGHKLGQIIGVLLQRTFKGLLLDFAARNDLYCDMAGPRPGVRKGRKVTWFDQSGNPHDLDYVLERGGSDTIGGVPVAFIEIAWRRYTKHSRNKAGELADALRPLAVSYLTTRFVGTILAGEFSEGGIRQLRSAGIDVLALPFATIEAAFASEGARINYLERATLAEKAALNQVLESLTDAQLERIAGRLRGEISHEYKQFEARLSEAVNASPLRVRIVTLFGFEEEYSTVGAAIMALEAKGHATTDLRGEPQGYEVFIEFLSGSEIKGRFATRDELIAFLKQLT